MNVLRDCRKKMTEVSFAIAWVALSPFAFCKASDYSCARSEPTHNLNRLPRLIPTDGFSHPDTAPMPIRHHGITNSYLVTRIPDRLLKRQFHSRLVIATRVFFEDFDCFSADAESRSAFGWRGACLRASLWPSAFSAG